MEPKFCKVCKDPIPEARVEALPETETCVKDSTVQPYRAFVEGTTKNKGFNVTILKADDPALAYLDDQYTTGEMVGESE
jgi:hypothetical protein